MIRCDKCVPGFLARKTVYRFSVYRNRNRNQLRTVDESSTNRTRTGRRAMKPLSVAICAVTAAGAAALCFAMYRSYARRKRRRDPRLYDVVKTVRDYLTLSPNKSARFPDFGDRRASHEFYTAELRKCFASHAGEANVAETAEHGINALIACPYRRVLDTVEHCLTEWGTEMLIEQVLCAARSDETSAADSDRQL